MIESLLLTATRVLTFREQDLLTNASGFFFQREERLFLVTSRHVMADDAAKHFPDRLQIELHANADNMAEAVEVSIPLYRDGTRLWRAGLDSGGDVDVAAIAIDCGALPLGAVYRSFTPEHLYRSTEEIEVGASVLVVGFPLGFHDTLHHAPVVRRAVIASSFGLRFNGKGYFLTDARTHRGTSGAPVVMRLAGPDPTHGDLPWMLLGVHSARLEAETRDLELDEALGLNCAWYADVLLPLTEG